MFFWNGRYVRDYLARIHNAVMAGDEAAGDELPELHATLAGLKVTSTTWAHDQIEECRRDCGGQGFLVASGVSHLGRSFGVASTGEGDRTILSMQVARFLIKSARAAREGSALVGSVAYLRDPSLAPLAPSGFAGRPDELVLLFRDRTARFATKLDNAFAAAQRDGKGFDDAMNANAVIAYRAAEAHSAYVMARNNLQSLNDYVKDPATRAVLLKVLELVLLQHVYERAGDWLGVLCAEHPDYMLARINALLSELRPDAVALTDAFGFPNPAGSTLGRQDGNVYEAIYATARKSPLNQSPRMVGWEHLGPMLDLDFLREGMRTQHAKL